MKHCLVFASLISPSKMILFEKKYQTFDTVFHHQMKHLEVRQKYSAARRIFNSLLSVSAGDETLHLMFDILLTVSEHLLAQYNAIKMLHSRVKMILEYAKAVKNGEQTCKILVGGGIQQNFMLGGSARDLITCP